MEQSRTSLPTLGIYITTNWQVGSKPRILEVRKTGSVERWFIGRSRETCDLVIPNAFISKVNGVIQYSEESGWEYQHLGTNNAYFSDAGKTKKMRKGQTVSINKDGCYVSFLYTEPAFVFEFFPGMEKKHVMPSQENTKTPDIKVPLLEDLKYIDTPVELAVYLFFSFLKASPWVQILMFLGFCGVLYLVYEWITNG